jgi:GT2 family glycosyltransferase
MNTQPSNPQTAQPAIGVVVIGRNEGERFRRCIASLGGPHQTQKLPIIYVDSGSTDGSQAFARLAGVDVVDLDMSTPFTAARARNAGLARLLELAPNTQFVQFVDGDCEVNATWLQSGAAALIADESVAAVAGRLRERFPEKSLYNRLADIEWDTPIGFANSCGGNAMFRVKALQEVAGFDPSLIAGEEPELCARLRANGYKIQRIAAEMALHDLAMFKQSQWLTRARRHGFAILEVSKFKTQASRDLFAQQIRSALVWGLAVPAVQVLFLLSSLTYIFIPTLTDLLALPATLLALLTIFQWLRIALRARREKKLSLGDSLLYSRLLLASKTSNVRGMFQFLSRRWNKGPTKLIDYKTQSA